MMRIGIAALYGIVGAVNLLPISGVLGAAQLDGLYGVAISDPTLLLLMRHRAVLLGIVGGVLMAAAFWPRVRTVATAIGLCSMASYLLLSLPPAQLVPELQRVYWTDSLAVVILVAAYGLQRRSGSTL